MICGKQQTKNFNGRKKIQFSFEKRANSEYVVAS